MSEPNEDEEEGYSEKIMGAATVATEALLDGYGLMESEKIAILCFILGRLAQEGIGVNARTDLILNEIQRQVRQAMGHHALCEVSEKVKH